MDNRGKITLEDVLKIRKMFDDIDDQVTQGIVKMGLDFNGKEVLTNLIERALKINKIEYPETYIEDIKDMRFFSRDTAKFIHNYYYKETLVLITEMDLMGFKYQIPTEDIKLKPKS